MMDQDGWKAKIAAVMDQDGSRAVLMTSSKLYVECHRQARS